MMKRVGLVYDDVFLKHETPEFHVESKARLTAIIRALKKSAVWKDLIHIKPRKAEFSDIALVHTERYIRKIRNFGTGYLDPDTYLSEGTLEAALNAAGALIEGLERCRSGEFERAFCAVRPPGHHAEADTAMGFCIFNNVAIGARYAQKIGYPKVFIVDYDVHHGNGTQHVFENDSTVYFFSTHQYPHYPGTGRDYERGKGQGEGFTYNVSMHPGAGDNEYSDIYRNVLPPLMKNFAPDIILVSAGYDILNEDPLSSLHVSREGIRTIVQNILKCSNKNSIPVIFALEGGYNLSALAEAVKITIEEMLK